MNEVLQEFLEAEVTQSQYQDMWNFITSRSVTRGTYEGNSFKILKTGSDTFIIYKEIIVPLSTIKYQNAVVVGRDYLLKKINSIAYAKRFENVNVICDW